MLLLPIGTVHPSTTQTERQIDRQYHLAKKFFKLPEFVSHRHQLVLGVVLKDPKPKSIQ